MHRQWIWKHCTSNINTGLAGGWVALSMQLPARRLNLDLTYYLQTVLTAQWLKESISKCKLGTKWKAWILHKYNTLIHVYGIRQLTIFLHRRQRIEWINAERVQYMRHHPQGSERLVTQKSQPLSPIASVKHFKMNSAVLLIRYVGGGSEDCKSGDIMEMSIPALHSWMLPPGETHHHQQSLSAVILLLYAVFTIMVKTAGLDICFNLLA